MTTASFKMGDKVRFRPGPKATMDVIAKVTGQKRAFLLTKDAAGKERKICTGACTKEFQGRRRSPVAGPTRPHTSRRSEHARRHGRADSHRTKERH